MNRRWKRCGVLLLLWSWIHAVVYSLKHTLLRQTCTCCCPRTPAVKAWREELLRLLQPQLCKKDFFSSWKAVWGKDSNACPQWSSQMDSASPSQGDSWSPLLPMCPETFWSRRSRWSASVDTHNPCGLYSKAAATRSFRAVRDLDNLLGKAIQSAKQELR